MTITTSQLLKDVYTYIILPLKRSAHLKWHESFPTNNQNEKENNKETSNSTYAQRNIKMLIFPTITF